MAQRQTTTSTYQNRCQRCNRQLKDANAQYGWRCAEILGINAHLNYSGDRAFNAYMVGIREADDFLAKTRIDTNKIDIKKFIESYAKQYLVAGMNDQKLWNLAYIDMQNALKPQFDKSGKMIFTASTSPPLANYLALRDGADFANGRFTTTVFTDNRFNPNAYNLQKALNNAGVTDKFGMPLREDGIFGPKTQWAADVARTLGDTGKGLVSHSAQSQYGPYITGGDTVFGIVDKTLGRVKNGKPVGVPIFRIDGAHNGASAPHLNANHQLYPNLKNLDHTEIPQSVYNLAKNGNKLTKIAKTGGKALTVAGIALDAYDLGNTIYLDLNDEDKKLGKKTLQKSIGIGGSYAGGFGGAKLGAMGGAAIGTLICPGLGTAIGGILGGIAGGIGGALGGRALGEDIVDKTYWGK